MEQMAIEGKVVILIALKLSHAYVPVNKIIIQQHIYDNREQFDNDIRYKKLKKLLE